MTPKTTRTPRKRSPAFAPSEPNAEITADDPVEAEKPLTEEPLPPREERAPRPAPEHPRSRASPLPRYDTDSPKLILRSRAKSERKRFSGFIRPKCAESVKLAPTYKILPKREETEETVTFKTKNPRARARIKKVMERWEPK